MKKLLLKITLISCCVFLTSCKDETKTKETFNEQKEIVNKEAGMDGHTSINSLDWEGTYQGTIPCSDCDGIFTELTLNNDNTFILYSTKMRGDKKDKTSSEGLYQWDESGSNITLEKDGMATMYKVGENKLILLDKNGVMVPETKTQNNTLLKKPIKE